MKKNLVLMALAAIFCLNASAQRNQMTAEQIEQFMAQRIERQADNLANEMGLKDEARAKFIATYAEYQKVLAAVSQPSNPEQAQAGQQRNRDKKELTAEEATQQIEKEFARQEEQITQMQQRLVVTRAYYAEFQKSLTPQQLVKVFGPRTARGFGGQGGQRMGGQRGNFGGGQGGNFGGGQGGGFGGDQGGFNGGGF